MKCYIIPLLLMLTLKISAQDVFRNSIQVGVLGEGGIYSVNYERIFAKDFTGKIGLSFINKNLIIPILAGKYFGKSPNYFDLSSGMIFAYYRDHYDENIEHYQIGVYGTMFIGYRYQPVQERFLFRIGYTPIFNNHTFFHWGGISLGYRF